MRGHLCGRDLGPPLDLTNLMQEACQSQKNAPERRISAPRPPRGTDVTSNRLINVHHASRAAVSGSALAGCPRGAMIAAMEHLRGSLCGPGSFRSSMTGRRLRRKPEKAQNLFENLTGVVIVYAKLDEHARGRDGENALAVG